VVYNRPVKFRQAAAELGIPDGAAHFEPTRGTPEQARDYCKKDPLEFVEHGDFAAVGQGKRTDLSAAAASAADTKMPMCDVILNHQGVAMRYSRGIHVVRAAAMVKERQAMRAIDQRRQVTTHVYWGVAGAGKTTRALKNKDLYILPYAGDKVIWFDGYMGQKAILLEDITPNCIALKALLNICDGAPMDFAVKGAFVRAEWTDVYITSNFHPKGWFTDITPESQAALARRMTEVIEFKAPPARFGQSDEVKWNDTDPQWSDSDSDVQIIE
jgi:hypothetical protein